MLKSGVSAVLGAQLIIKDISRASFVASESDLEDVILIDFMMFDLFCCVFIENMVENIVVCDLVTAKSIGAQNKHAVALFENKTR